jgi:hypothetical protein
MDRIFVYPGAIPQDTDILNSNRNPMIALGYLAQACLGSGTIVDGLACNPTIPASLTVNIGPGSIFSLQTIDSTAYGSLAADFDPLLKIGANPFGVTSLILTPPVASGFTINYVVEANFSETDTNATVIPYYNAATPSQPFSGPNNSGANQNTLRQQRVALQLKAGTPGPTGSQVTPAPDLGWVGLYVIPVSNAQTTITSGNISVYPAAPFLANKIPSIPAGVVLPLTTSGTFVVPPGIYGIDAELWGAGGGSGGTFGAGTSSVGGGAGGYTRGKLAVTPGQSILYTVGTGGTAGASASTPGNGGNGTGSTFLTLSATGGAGGGGSNSGLAVGVANGGVGTGGYLNITGGTSSGACLISGTTIIVSQGGQTYGTPPTHIGANPSSAGGLPGFFPGGGAGGALNQAGGAAGANGFIILRY